jgi:serine/threonine-protein kinase
VYVVYDWDWAGAEREFKRLALQAPGSAYAHSGPALLYMALGRWDDALREVSASLTVDPLDPDVYQTLMEIQLGRDRLAESEAAIRRTLEIRPTYAWGHALVGLVMLFRGDAPGALAEIHQEPDPQAQQEMLTMAFFALGHKTESDVALTQMIKKYANDSAYAIGVIYAFRGQREEAIKWLERAYAQKDAFLQFAKAELSPTALASDPRYKAFLRKMNLPE